MHHLAFRTRDLPRLEAFYVNVLGFTLKSGGTQGRSVWLDAGGAIVMLERADTEEVGVDPRSMELVAFAIERSARAGCESALRAAGVAVEATTAFTVYFRDPDGRRVALSHYPDGA